MDSNLPFGNKVRKSFSMTHPGMTPALRCLFYLRCLRSFAHEPGEEFREVRSTRHHLQLGPVLRGYREGIHDEELADPHFAQPL